ncbi:MAG: hypothetical protein ACRD3Q_11390, partial [Terriglobales bacterium]
VTRCAKARSSSQCLPRKRKFPHFRDQQGLELDFLMPRHAELWLIESKASKTVRPTMAAPLLSLRRSLAKRTARLMVIHRKPHSSLSSAALAPGVEAVDIERFVQELNR